jgi:hypothetical protein
MSMIDTIQAMLNQELDDLHTAAPARIESFDPVKMTASVTLLYKIDNQIVSPIVEVPVSTLKAGPFIIRPPYKTGDIVLVVFSERSLDYILQNDPQDTQSGENIRHRLDDAIVIGGIKLDTQPNLPATNADDLLILNQSTGSKAVMTATGDIILEGNSIYLGSSTATEGVPKGSSLKDWLDSHTHGGGAAPDTTSPEPSTKVKVI